MTDTWLIVGLGNPGTEYSNNRHNVGQMVLDELARRVGGSFKVHKARAHVLEGRLGIGGPRVVLAKPMSYMNVSGGPVSALAKFYGINPEHVVAVHDEIDIPFNTVKLKIGGGEGGHNGLRDISKASGHQGLPAGPRRCGTSAGQDGHRRLRPEGLRLSREKRAPLPSGRRRRRCGGRGQGRPSGSTAEVSHCSSVTLPRSRP